MSVCHVNIYSGEQMMFHKIVITLVIIRGQSDILIQVYTGYLGKIQITLLIPLYQLIVSTDRGRSGCQTQYAIGFHNNLCRNQIRCTTTYCLIVFLSVNSHVFHTCPHFCAYFCALVLVLC